MDRTRWSKAIVLFRDLVIMDSDMPVTSDIEVNRRILAVRPEIRVPVINKRSDLNGT